MKNWRLSYETITKPDRVHDTMLPRFLWRLIGVIAISLFLDGFSLHAATLPAGFTETQVGSNLSGTPTAMDFAPDGRLFVCLQEGRLRVIENGVLLATPFVTVTTTANGERGLLGIAFDPNFASNQFVYVYYTVITAPIHNRVSRFTANGNVAVAGSETVILELDNLSGATNHNGGRSTLDRTGSFMLGWERMRTLQTLKQWLIGLERCCASTRMGPFLLIIQRPFRESPVLLRHQSRDLGGGIAESLHLCVPAGHGPALHQRRWTKHLGRDQRWHRWIELWMEPLRRRLFTSQRKFPGPLISVRPYDRQHGRMRHSRRRLLQSSDQPVSRQLHGQVFLR